MWWWSFPILIWSSTALLLLLVYRRDAPALWREPVLKRPVLILESDDWGAGPAKQTEALNAIAAIVSDIRDCDGRHPVFTLALVLSTAAGRGEEGDAQYRYVSLLDRHYDELRTVIKSGRDAGVFAPQLHGMAHFWPPALELAAAENPTVAAWMEESPETGTEALPATLQSRWVDAGVLPSHPLPVDEIKAAATEEVEYFARCFGFRPAVAVPPTFVWNHVVEQAWQAAGVHVVVTPGRRFESRDGCGRPTSEGAAIRNGERSPAGVLYVVRDDYFEPEKGHTAEWALAALARKTRLGRPTLLETHRSNFLDPRKRQRALGEIRSLFERALQTYPDLAFVSTERLAHIMENNDSDWIEGRLPFRLHSYIERLWALPRMRKLMWLTTLMLPVGLLWALSAGSDSDNR